MIILNDGTYYEPDDEHTSFFWQTCLFRTVDIFAELNAMAACGVTLIQRNVRRQDGIKQLCITSWLKYEHRQTREKGVSPFAEKMQSTSGKIGLKSWSFLDDCTHDFLKSEKFRAYCLEKYGQYVTFEGERVTA